MGSFKNGNIEGFAILGVPCSNLMRFLQLVITDDTYFENFLVRQYRNLVGRQISYLVEVFFVNGSTC